jgi:DNA-binding CsgD family transcriptional regulator
MLARSRAGGDATRTAMALLLLGMVTHREGDPARAQDRYYEGSLALFRDLRHTDGMAMVLSHLAWVAGDRGDHERAVPLFEEALALWQARGDAWGAAHALNGLADSARAQGNVARAAVLSQQALAHYAELRDRYRMAGRMEDLAGVAGLLRLPEQAARLFGAAEGLRETVGAPVAADDRELYERDVAAVRAALDETAFAAAWAAGRALSIEEAVAEAMAVEPSAPPSPAESLASPHGLSLRELEVLRLVAAGHTDREIAEALFISYRTVQTHMTNIFGKLGVNTRAAAAAFTIRHGLA